jgi:hypothetical protein
LSVSNSLLHGAGQVHAEL